MPRRVFREEYNKKCVVCGKTFQARTPRQRFCSSKCVRVLVHKPRTGKIFECLVCGKKFYSRPSAVGKLCSNECRIKYSRKNQVVFKCLNCGKEYRRPVSQAKKGSSFCSYRCGAVWRFSGYKNPRWKGGVSTESHRLHASKVWKDWRKAVFERDNYTCQICGEHGGYLEPHHIKEFCNYKELRFVVSNGITLCKNCHRTTTKMGRYRKEVKSRG